MRISKLWLYLFCIFICSNAFSYEKPAAPIQPAKGYGGSDYKYSSVNVHSIDIQENKYYLFTPVVKIKKKAGLIIFLHDWLTTEPQHYYGWIKHLVKKGWFVVFPKYQGSGQPPKNYLFNVVRSVKACIKQIFLMNSLELNREKVAIIGHGAGAVIGANIAATSEYFGLPWPKALFLLMPYRRNLKLLDLSGIRSGTKMLIGVGDKIEKHTEEVAREIFYAADRIATSDKNYLTFLSDYYGSPPVIADENMPLAPERPVYKRPAYKRRHEFVKLSRDRFHAPSIRAEKLDAMDWLGTFRLFDAMTAHIFYGKSSEDSFGDTPQQRFMGYWSDGKKLRGILSSVRP
jgi:esterase/lipase